MNKIQIKSFAKGAEMRATAKVYAADRNARGCREIMRSYSGIGVFFIYCPPFADASCENPAESAEVHRISDPTTKRTPGTGTSHACSEAEFTEAHGGSMRRLVLRAFEDSSLAYLRRVGIIKKRKSQLPY